MYIEDVCIAEDEVLVRVDYISVCKADLRYYEGTRDARVLSLKYPISLIHEATGIVVKDNTSQFQPGDRVVLIPNAVNRRCELNCVCEDKHLGENYCPYAEFASSSADGFSKEYVKRSAKQIVRVPEKIPSKLAVFTEMISVACAAIRRMDHLSGNIGIWGDGILGYILTLTIKMLHPDCKVILFGKHLDKMDKFTDMVDYVYSIHDPINIKVDVAFECVGGASSSQAINQALHMLRVGGSLILTGVTEQLVPIHTRSLLEKGIQLTGTTRSQKSDFAQAISLLKEESFSLAIEKLVLSENEVSDLSQFYEIFEIETASKMVGRHIMKLNL